MRGPGPRPSTLALGTSLALRRPTVLLALAMACVEAIGATVMVASGHASAAVMSAPHAPLFIALIVCWSAGVLVAVGGGMGAFLRDREEGIAALLGARCVSAWAYVCGRIGGVVMLMAAVSTAPVVLLGVVALARSTTPGSVAGVLQSTVAGLVYGCAFATCVGSLALASLGWRKRSAGYLAFIAILVVPELLSLGVRSGADSWRELSSIPAALDAVQAGIAGTRASALAAVRALTGLVAFTALCVVIVRARAGAANDVGARA